jgi:hypothetical protein
MLLPRYQTGRRKGQHKGLQDSLGARLITVPAQGPLR